MSPQRRRRQHANRRFDCLVETNMADGLFEENCAKAAIPTRKECRNPSTASTVQYCWCSDSLARTRSKESATTSGAQKFVTVMLKTPLTTGQTMFQKKGHFGSEKISCLKYIKYIDCTARPCTKCCVTQDLWRPISHEINESDRSLPKKYSEKERSMAWGTRPRSQWFSFQKSEIAKKEL